MTQTTLVGYTIINGTWSIQLALLVASVYNYVMFPEVFDSTWFKFRREQLTADEIQSLNNLRKFDLPIIHGLLFVLNSVVSSSRLNLDCGKQFFAFIGMVLMVVLIFDVTSLLYVFPETNAIKFAPENVIGCFIWIELEWMIFLAVILSNIFFILIRTMITHKIQLDQVPVRKQLPDVDTIVAIKEVADEFAAQYVPFIVSILIFFQPNGTNTGQLYWTLKMILLSNMASVVCITFLVFVSWKKGPAWWTKISHYVFFILLLLNYIIIPLANIVVFVWYVLDPTIDLKSEPIESYIIFFSVICFARIMEYVTLVRRTVVLDARIFLQQKQAMMSKTAEELRKEIFDAAASESNLEEDVQRMVSVAKEILNDGKKGPYAKRFRGYGQGEIRLGTTFELRQDIYSLGFISQIDDDIMDEHFDVLTGRLKSDTKAEPPVQVNEETPAPPTTSLAINTDDDDPIEFERYHEREGSDDDGVDEEDPEQLLTKREFAKMQRIFEIKKQKRLNIVTNTLLTFMFQMTLIILTFYELGHNCEYWSIIIAPVDVYIMIARFICATILHLSLVDEVNQGLTMMKYAVNHSYRFHRHQLAFISGFLQTVACLGVELANIGVVQGANDTISIVFNFIALAIIAEFDNYVYDSLKNESFKQLTEREFTSHALVVMHTTSKKCDPSEKSTQIDANG